MIPQITSPRRPRPRPTSTESASLMGRWLARTLDELDHGVVLLDAHANVLHANRRAHRLLDDDTHPLELQGPRLAARDPRDAEPLADGLQAAARRALRGLLKLGDGEARRVIALVPVELGVAAMMLCRDRSGDDLSFSCFSRTHGLTSAEMRVLAALGDGLRPTEIAQAQGVKLSTVRTHIGSIRDKTGARSITAMVRLVASLPPMVGALRG